MALIIYAEDDPLMGSIVRNALAQEGHVVGIVEDGLSALRAINTKQPALVILDCSIPELSGIEVLRSLRLDKKFYDLPIMMLTGRNSIQDLSLAAYAGADGYVKKPFDPDYLRFLTNSMLMDGRSAGNMAH